MQLLSAGVCVVDNIHKTLPIGTYLNFKLQSQMESTIAETN